MNYPNRIFTKIQITLLTIFVVGCTCLPFSSPPSKTPIVGALSYSDILTYIGTNVKSDPKWSGWNGTADESQPLNYSITPASPYVTINQETGEITVLAKELFSNSYIVSVNGYGDFEERVSTTLSVEVKPPFLYNVANVSDDDPLTSFNVGSVATSQIGENTYLFVGGNYNSRVSMFSVDGDGQLDHITNIEDTTVNFNGLRGIHTAQIGESNYLFMAGHSGPGISVFLIGSDNSLVNVAEATSAGTLKIRGVTSLLTANLGGTFYLFAAGWVSDDKISDRISVFSVNRNGSLVHITNVNDDGDMKINGVTGFSTSVIGGTPHLFVAGVHDNGVSVFSLGDDGSLNNVYNLSDDDDHLKLKGAYSTATATVGESNYLFVAGINDHGVSVFFVNDGGSLVNVYNVSDNDNIELEGASSVITAVVAGTTYLFVSGWHDSGVSVFSVGNDGSLDNVYNVSDNDTLNLDGARLSDTAVVGEVAYLFVPGLIDEGVSVFSINP